jgi:CzcA family heavy metal efflux pump
LGDIAEIKIGPKAPQTGLASYGTKPAVLLTVTKQPNVSTLDLTDKIDRSIEDLKKSIPASVEIKTDAFRQSRFIESSIHNIQSSLFEGAIFVVLVLMLFLMNVRTTVISLVTIPLSLLFTLLVMYFLGMTINTMSIGGMAIAIGSLVDDAIVDVENVYKRLRENSLKPLENRLPIIKVVYEASKEVRMPILNSTMIIVVSFVPLFFLSGMEGRMLQPLGIAFIIALFSSTLVALTVTPVLCSYLLKKENSAASKEAKFSLKLRSVYQKALNWSLENGRVVLTSALVAFVVALILFFNFGRSFLPSFNEGSLTINVSTIPGVSLEVSEELGRQAEEILLTIPEIQTVSRKTGRAELDEHALGVNVSEIEAPFELSDRSKEEMIKEVRHKMSHIPGVAVEIGQPISHRIDAMLSGTRANIAIKIFGSDLNQLFQLGNQIKREISGVEGIADLNVEQQIERPQLKIIPRRDLLVRYGIPLSEFREYVEVLLGGEVVSQVYEGDKTFDLTIKVRDESRDGIEKIRNILIDTNEGKIPLGYVADVVSASGPNLINRENVSRKVVVSANVADRDLRSVVDDIQKCVDEKIHLPEGYHVEYGGQFESEQAASRILLFTCLLSVLVIFLLLYNQFKSATQSLVILLNLPLALIGGAVAIALTGGVMSIPSIIGFISLFGIATRNGMLLVDRYNELCKEGLSLHETIVKGSLDRLNPILMTALSSALAMIPLAIGGDLPGNEIQSPMAIVILGGLFSSTFLNAFVIPIVYMKMKNRF